MDKALIVSSSVAVITAGIAAWALYKWLHVRQVLKIYTDKYSDLKEVQRQLFQHFGNVEELPQLKEIIPKEAENYHIRLAQFCSDMCDKYEVTKGRVLDVGCGPGGTSFNLSAHFENVVGTDISYSMIVVGQQLKQFAEIGCLFSNEGGKHISHHCMRVPDRAFRERVVFWDEDVCALIYTCGKFNCVLVSNTLTDMHDPKAFLVNIGQYVEIGGLLIISDVFNWSNGPEEFFGGEGECLTPSLLEKLLNPTWTLQEENDMSFYVPRCKRLAEVGNANVTVWKRMEDELPEED